MNANGNFDGFNSLNGGISMCLKALSGVLIRHGLKETILSAESSLSAEASIPAQNDLFFLCTGLKALDTSILEGKIQHAASHYREMATKAECFSKNGNGFQEIDKQWKDMAFQTQVVCKDLGKWCNDAHLKKISGFNFGIANPLEKTRFLDWNELGADFLTFSNTKEYFDEKVSELFVFVEEKYVNGEIGDDLSINSFSRAINALSQKHDELSCILRESDTLWRTFEASQSQYRESSSALFQELAKLPLSSQWGLYRYCSPKFAKEGHFPDLFALKNIKPIEL